MNRRHFMQGAAAVSVSTLLNYVNSAPGAEGDRPRPTPRGAKSWLFWDLWHFDRFDQLVLCQGEATWRPEGTYIDPLMFGHNSWPTVQRDPQTKRWRMWYSTAWKPFTLMVAESDDGIRWHPSPQPKIQPPGKKLAPQHVFTLEDGSAGGVYLDPVARDGRPFKIFAHQQGDAVFHRARKDPNHRWHEIARKEGSKRYMTEELTLVSRDGLTWEIDAGGRWGQPDWHPEPPLFGFYQRDQRRHAMTVRPGWGDRRVCIQTSEDCQHWSGPELLLQPDALDAELLQHYGMPTFPYDIYYVGLLWIFHSSDAEPLRSFNQFVGPIDCQLTFGYDGNRFTRGPRRPLVPRNRDGEHGCAVVQPSCLVETENEIRIYSGAGKIMHGLSRSAENARKRQLFAITQHTLRKDGFMYLRPRGDWGRFLSKPMTLNRTGLTMNAEAPFGEICYQITDLESRPVKGFTFEECIPVRDASSFNHPLAWREAQLDTLVHKVFRLEVRLRNARLYSIRGDWHFLDAQDRWMLDDNKPINTTLFDH